VMWGFTRLILTSVKFQQIKDHLSTFKQKNERLAEHNNMLYRRFYVGTKGVFLLIKNLPHFWDLCSI